MTYHKCRYNDCAVCSDPANREIFEFIFQRKNIDIYACESVIYKIYDEQRKNFIICNLANVRKGKRGYYIINPFTGNPIELSANNVQILCTAADCTAKDPYVHVWKGKVTKDDQ